MCDNIFYVFEMCRIDGRFVGNDATINVNLWHTTYQLILIGSDCGENGFWENVGSVTLLLNISDGMVDALGPDD